MPSWQNTSFPFSQSFARKLIQTHLAKNHECFSAEYTEVLLALLDKKTAFTKLQFPFLSHFFNSDINQISKHHPKLDLRCSFAIFIYLTINRKLRASCSYTFWLKFFHITQNLWRAWYPVFFSDRPNRQGTMKSFFVARWSVKRCFQLLNCFVRTTSKKYILRTFWFYHVNP